MKLTKRKDGKFSLVGMTKEEVSVIKGLVGMTSAGLNKEEANIYKTVSEFPSIYYVNAGKPEYPALFRKETK